MEGETSKLQAFEVSTMPFSRMRIGAFLNKIKIHVQENKMSEDKMYITYKQLRDMFSHPSETGKLKH
jgi:uncharacterized lipoprotein